MRAALLIAVAFGALLAKADGKSAALTLASTTAGMVDGESTLHMLQHCLTCIERNPLLGSYPDRSQLYAFGTFEQIGLAAVAGKLRQHKSRWWWIPQAAATGVHAYFAYRNYSRF